MGLELDIEELNDSVLGLVRRGRPRAQITYEIVRPIKAADLAMLAATDGLPNAGGTVKRLTDRHHGLARLIASGVAVGEAGAIMGYEGPRVSVLQADPAFQELVSMYRERVDEAFVSTMDQLSGMNRDVILELRERLEQAPEKFSNNELRQLLETSLDRTGYGPTHKQETSITVSLSERLDEARKRALAARRAEAQIIDAEVINGD
jgi:hypothetical protein